MLAQILRAVLRRPYLVVALAAIVLFYGAFALFGAKYDVFPEFVPAQAEIQVEAPGLAPEEVERLITQPLENAINGGANIAAVRSESIQGLAAINVVFDEGSDAFRDRQLLAERVAEAASALPPGIRAPTLGPLTSSTMDLLKVGFTSKTLSGMDLRTFVDTIVRPRVLAVPGVARAIVYGGGRREIQIQVHPARLQLFDLALADVVAAASSLNATRGAGFIDTPTQRVLIGHSTSVKSPDDIAQLVVTQREGRNVAIGDVATVAFAIEPPFGEARVQGEPDVLISISSQFGANTLEVTHALEARLAELQPMFESQGITTFPELHRPANFIEIALVNMRNSLLIGALFVLVILVGFLRDWRTALISFITIPLTLVAAAVVITLFGWTINTMTLGGLAVAVGVVVDDAIIDVENIARRIRIAARTNALTLLDAIILNASLEVRRPIVLATVVVGMVFLPILLLPGLQGSFFAPLAAAFLIATFASLLVALTLTPALSLVLLRRRAQLPPEPRWMRRFKVAHRRVLKQMQGGARGALITSLVVGVLALAAAFFFGSELLPEFREGHFVAQVNAPAGTSLEEMTRLGSRISKDMLAIAGIKTVSQQVGRAEGGEDTWGTNRCEFHIELERGLAGERQEEIEKELRTVLDAYPALQSEVVTFLGDRISESFSGETAAMVVNVFGANLEDLDAAAALIAGTLAKMPDAEDVQLQRAAGMPLMNIEPRADRISALGVRPNDIAEATAIAFQGAITGQVYEGPLPIAVRVLFDRESRRDPESIGTLSIKTVAGRHVPLNALADVHLDSTRASILHESGQRRQVVTLNPDTNDIVGFMDAARQKLGEIKLPKGVSVELTGTAVGAKNARRDLLIHSTIAAIGVVILLLLTFNSWRTVGLILVNVPFALVGGVVAVALTDRAISIGSLVGFVTLFGISARNSIMLIAHYEHLVTREGIRWNRFAAWRGARERLTPILMTAVVTALGLLPLALGSGEAGREVEGPMAIVILGGLLSSTLLNVLLLPAIAGQYFSRNWSNVRPASSR